MSENVQVNFKVSGSELSSYMDNIKKKSDAMTASAIAGALEQNKQSKEQLKLIDDQIKAIERKTRMEGQAARTILQDKRDAGLGRIRDRFEGQRNDIYSDNSLSEKDKKEKIIASQGSQQEAEVTLKNQYRENLNSVKENERQAKLQTHLAKEQIDTLKATAEKNVKAITSGDLKLADVISTAQTDDQRLVAKLTEENVNGLRKKSNEGEYERKGGSFFSDILKAESFNKALDIGNKISQSKNGYDLISDALSAPTSWLETLFSGVPIFEGLTKLLNGAVEGGAEFLERKAISGQGYLTEAYKYNGITGSDPNNSYDMSESGINATDFLKYRTDYARKRGYGATSNETARDALYAEKGFGIDQNTSSSLVEMQRSSRENNRDLAGLIGGILEKGQGNIFKNGDNAFLNEFLGKFSSLQKDLLKNQTVVATGTTMDIMNRFNKVGGEFDARDSRSAGNINAIQSGLSNPNSDNIKALAYRVLSKRNPNMGIFDLDEQMSQGMGSKDYLRDMLGMVDQMGGGDQVKMKNLQGLFKGLSPSAVRTLFNNREGLMNGSISMDELQGSMPGEFKDRSEANTAPIERNAATIESQILNGTISSLEAIAVSTKEAIQDAFSGAVININGQSGTIEFVRPQNKTINPNR